MGRRDVMGGGIGGGVVCNGWRQREGVQKSGGAVRGVEERGGGVRCSAS